MKEKKFEQLMIGEQKSNEKKRTILKDKCGTVVF